MVDLRVLKHSWTTDHEESEEELTTLIANTFEDDGSEKMIAMERQLSLLNQYIKVDSLPPLEARELVKMGILSEEAISFTGIKEGIVKGIKSVGGSLAKFAAWVHNTIQNKTVSEKYIIKKFTKLEHTLADSETSRGYVKDVPTFEEVQKRLAGILNACGYIKDLSTNEQGSYDDSVFDRIVQMSNGVFKADVPYEGSSYRNLKWDPPKLTQYEVIKSPWNNASNLQRLRNLTVEVKYQSLEDLATAASSLVKKCSQFRDEGAYSNDEYGEVAQTYNAAYVINKLVKQINAAINKEVNTLCIQYITRLIHFTTV